MSNNKLANLFEGLQEIDKSISKTYPEMEALIKEIEKINTSIEELKTLHTTLTKKGEADKAELTRIEEKLNDMKKNIETTTQKTKNIKSSLDGIQTTGTKNSTSNSTVISKNDNKPTYDPEDNFFKSSATPPIDDVFDYFNKNHKYDRIKDFKKRKPNSEDE